MERLRENVHAFGDLSDQVYHDDHTEERSKGLQTIQIDSRIVRDEVDDSQECVTYRQPILSSCNQLPLFFRG